MYWRKNKGSWSQCKIVGSISYTLQMKSWNLFISKKSSFICLPSSNLYPSQSTHFRNGAKKLHFKAPRQTTIVPGLLLVLLVSPQSLYYLTFFQLGPGSLFSMWGGYMQSLIFPKRCVKKKLNSDIYRGYRLVSLKVYFDYLSQIRFLFYRFFCLVCLVVQCYSLVTVGDD